MHRFTEITPAIPLRLHQFVLGPFRSGTPVLCTDI
uniref:Uncharacterized protein n=1 Tax=Utricularia reniformis TaxID=192314 RepID=A0A1Y0B3Z7_9LAMI|nr:hypothetical protein AEK19_MT1956 [Utricularia reniformis]ART32118.1 hypothetical protein AEK19_MT1956 [Utricularia reniformis]